MLRQNQDFFLATFFLFIAFAAKANNYYFSSMQGDDSRSSIQAQNPATPWKTINKLNSFFTYFKPGDSILFSRNEIFDGNIDVKKSGSILAHIIFSSYGKGNMPVISGLLELSAWAFIGNGIYQSTCSFCTSSDKLLIINGAPQMLGRFPNKGYLTYQSHTANTSITDKNFADAQNWSGADIVIKKKHWIIDRSNIVSQSGNTFNYAKGTSSSPTDGYGYFIENDARTLDQFGEWYFDSTQKKMNAFFGNEKPESYVVKSSAENFLVNINGNSFINFENLSFEGANISAFRIKNAQSIVLQNCHIDFSGTDAVNASGAINLDIENSVINHSQNDAITLDSSCRLAIIKNNLIKNTGLIPGMGKNGTGNYQAISAFGATSLIEFNEIDSTGYDAIYFGGNNSEANNNLIQYFCITKDDGAGIYIGDWFASTGKKITGNIILNGVGTNEGTTTKSIIQAEGIYIDDNTASVTIQANSVANCPDAGIKIHNAHDIKIEDNTIFNNSNQLLLQHDNLSPNSQIKNVTISGNLFFCKTTKQICVNILSPNDDTGSFGSMDNNYYYRTDNADAPAQITSNIWTPNSVTKNLSLSDWQKIYKQDLHSKMIFSKFSDIDFEYNFSKADRKFQSNGNYIQLDKTMQSNSFMLHPYQSVLIIKD